jgi:type IV secretory pathway VirB9-like protein
MWSTIVLPPWEEIEEYYLGDNRFFEVRTGERRRNVLLIRPVAAVETDTSLTVTGRARSNSAPAWYTFYLRSEPVESPRITDITVFVTADGPDDGVRSVAPASWSHAGAADLARTMAETEVAVRRPGAVGEGGVPRPDEDDPAEWLREIPFDPAKWVFDDYRVLAETDDAVSIAPVRVWHDGVFTYLDFGKDRADVIQRPVVMRVVDEVDNPVNTRTVGEQGEILVVESVGRTLTLRNGRHEMDFAAWDAMMTGQER